MESTPSWRSRVKRYSERVVVFVLSMVLVESWKWLKSRVRMVNKKRRAPLVVGRMQCGDMSGTGYERLGGEGLSSSRFRYVDGEKQEEKHSRGQVEPPMPLAATLLASTRHVTRVYTSRPQSIQRNLFSSSTRRAMAGQKRLSPAALRG